MLLLLEDYKLMKHKKSYSIGLVMLLPVDFLLINKTYCSNDSEYYQMLNNFVLKISYRQISMKIS